MVVSSQGMNEQGVGPYPAQGNPKTIKNSKKRAKTKTVGKVKKK